MVRDKSQADMAWYSIRILYGPTEIGVRIHDTLQIDIPEVEVQGDPTGTEHARRWEVSEIGEKGTNTAIEIAIATAIGGGDVVDIINQPMLINEWSDFAIWGDLIPDAIYLRQRIMTTGLHNQ